MKITLTKKELKRVLDLIRKVPLAAHPILNLLTITPQAITVNRFDCGLMVEIDATEHEDGVISMEWADLQEYLAQSDGEITIESKSDYKVKLTCENGIDIDMLAQGNDPAKIEEESPEAPEPPKKFIQVFKGFKDDLRRCVVIKAPEVMRFALNGILFNLTKTKLQIAASDGKRAYINDGKVKGGKKARVIVPGIIGNFLKEIDDETEFAIDEKNGRAFFDMNAGTIRHLETRLWTRLVEGEFPKIEDTIPSGKAVNHVDFKEPIAKKVLGALKKLRTDDSGGVVLIKPSAAKPLEVESTIMNDTKKVTTLKIPCKGRLVTKRKYNKFFLWDALIEQPEKINFYQTTDPITMLYENGGKHVIMPMGM